MKTIRLLVLAGVVLLNTAALVHSAGPSDEFAKNAFREIVGQVDTNRDGKLSLAECKGIYKDAVMAEKNCTFWDVDKDGTITEAEYVGQAMSMGKKK
jgi:Ca2+-binding EF-hand superfamily protein